MKITQMFSVFFLHSLCLSHSVSLVPALCPCPLLLTRRRACPVSGRAWFSICDLNQQVSCMAFPLFSRCLYIAFLSSCALCCFLGCLSTCTSSSSSSSLPFYYFHSVLAGCLQLVVVFVAAAAAARLCQPLCALVQRCQALTFVISSSPQSVNNAIWIGSSYEQQQSAFPFPHPASDRPVDEAARCFWSTAVFI